LRSIGKPVLSIFAGCRIEALGAGVGASNRTLLQAVLTADYDNLVKRLTRRFGCEDFASETLHETFARLDGVSDTTAVRSPRDYLFRTAINVGRNRRKAERYRASAAEIDAVLNVADEAPDPARVMEARSDMNALMPLLEELPLRSRKAFQCAVFDAMPYRQIAEDLGVTVRTVESDLQHAIEHCARRLGRDLTRRSSGPRRRA
jgi:RNA polymerase sigma-70 factor, ECF subfamily